MYLILNTEINVSCFVQMQYAYIKLIQESSSSFLFFVINRNKYCNQILPYVGGKNNQNVRMKKNKMFIIIAVIIRSVCRVGSILFMLFWVHCGTFDNNKNIDRKLKGTKILIYKLVLFYHINNIELINHLLPILLCLRTIIQQQTHSSPNLIPSLG